MIKKYDTMKASSICARILIYDGLYPEKVIYLRSGMDIDFAVRWRWYFDYLAALVKVHHPKRKVELSVGVQDVLLGQEWIDFRTANLLKNRRAKLKRLEMEIVEDDLFNFKSQDHQTKISKVKKEIEQLENGTYPIPVFPEYVNEIKKWIK